MVLPLDKVTLGEAALLMDQVSAATSTPGLGARMAHRLLTRSPLGLLVRWVARLTDEDPSRMLPQEASMAKLAATEATQRAVARAT